MPSSTDSSEVWLRHGATSEVIVPEERRSFLEGAEALRQLPLLTAERDQLRAENERLRHELEFETAENDFDCGGVRSSLRSATARAEAAERERDEAQAHAADLRVALEQVAAYEGECIDKYTAKLINASIARTPAKSLGRIKAEALDGAWKSIAALETIPVGDLRDRHINEGIRQALDVVFELRQIEYDRLEQEAANGR